MTDTERAHGVVAHTRGEMRIIRSDGESRGAAACYTCEHFRPRSADCNIGVLKHCYPLSESVCQLWAERGTPSECVPCVKCGNPVSLPILVEPLCSSWGCFTWASPDRNPPPRLVGDQQDGKL